MNTQTKLGEIITQIRGVSYKPSDVRAAGDPDAVALLRANNIQEDGLNFDDLIWVDKQKVGAEQYLRLGDILICSSSGSKGLVGKAAIVTSDLSCAFGAFCKVVRTKAEYASYLGQFFRSPRYRKEISASAAGANINNIRNEHIDEMFISMPSANERAGCVAKLGQIDYLIQKTNNQSHQLDQLVKSRFVEMFGDPVSNSMGLPTEPMTAVCTIIDGDRGKYYPKQDEFSDTGYCLFLNAKNVTTSGFSFENCMFITKEKDTALRNGKLERGDVVLTTRGTLGNLAFYDDSVPFENVRINSGMVILRMKKCVMTEVFFIEQFKLQLQSIKRKIASGSAQPQLPISTMNKIRILLAPMALQKQFAAFVSEVDKSKLAVKQSLEKLETLKKSLMQQYFS